MFMSSKHDSTLGTQRSLVLVPPFPLPSPLPQAGGEGVWAQPSVHRAFHLSLKVNSTFLFYPLTEGPGVSPTDRPGCGPLTYLLLPCLRPRDRIVSLS